MTNQNRKSGTSFERLLSLKLAENGFWSHCLSQNLQGQPFDVICARNGKVYAIDCKVCEKNTFAFSRVEPNQAGAMSVWANRGNGTGWFALRLNTDEVFMLSYSVLLVQSTGRASLSEELIRSLAIPFEEWVSKCE